MSGTYGPLPGPPTVDAAAFAPPDLDAPAPSWHAATGPRSVVTMINPALREELRVFCAKTRMTITGAVMTAHLECGEKVQQLLQPTDDDKDAVAMGLAPRRSRGRLGPGQPLAMWLTAAMLGSIDDAARSVNVTRRRYVTELLTALLRPTSPPAEQPT